MKLPREILFQYRFEDGLSALANAKEEKIEKLTQRSRALDARELNYFSHVRLRKMADEKLSFHLTTA